MWESQWVSRRALEKYGVMQAGEYAAAPNSLPQFPNVPACGHHPPTHHAACVLTHCLLHVALQLLDVAKQRLRLPLRQSRALKRDQPGDSGQGMGGARCLIQVGRAGLPILSCTSPAALLSSASLPPTS